MKIKNLLITVVSFLISLSLTAQKTYIPDDNFEQALIDLGYDSGALDDSVLTRNINTISYLDLNWKNISTLTGIEDFGALKGLSCRGNQLTSFNYSGFTLDSLNCGNNPIINLDLNNQINLKELRCCCSNIETVDLTNCCQLDYIDLFGNKLTSINLTNNTLLKKIDCSYNNLTSIDLTNNNMLEEVCCYRNSLTTIDLTQNTQLKYLNCHLNDLSSLNIKNGNNANLDLFTCLNPNLFCIEVDDPDAALTYSNWTKDLHASYSSDCSTFMQKTYIPDDNFEQALIDLGYDSGALDDSVLTRNINTITYLDLNWKNITTLTGIEDFSALKGLSCNHNQLTSLDLCTNNHLENLHCNGNNISSLFLSNPNLNVLYCADNNLTNINLSNISLDTLHCEYNPITDIDLSNQFNLKGLNCSNSNIETIDLTNNNRLENLDFSSNKITNIDLSANTMLWFLECSNNPLTSLNIRNQIYLKNLHCNSTNIETINLTNNNLLEIISCSSNRITTIDLSKNTQLNFLGCRDNQLTTLDLTANNMLTTVFCERNQLQSLSIGNNSAITTLLCHDNKLGSIDIRECPNLDGLHCYNNQLSSLNIKNRNNQNFYLDARNNPNLFCIEVDDPVVATTNSRYHKDTQASYSIDCSVTNYDMHVVCEPFKWIDGNTYSENNNTATYTLKNSQGGDSIITLDLTILKPSYGTDVHIACDSYTWINSKTYTSSNDTDTFTLTNADGCDSIVTLDLTINRTTYNVDVQTACENFTWIDGRKYTENNNTATYSFANSQGCDSIITLDLTILHSTQGVDEQTACENFTWIDGITYTESNHTATYMLKNSVGCDSLVNLSLTILHPIKGIDVLTACKEFTWIDGITYTENNKTATFTLKNAAGCDSIVTLDLTILKPSYGNDVQTACDAFTWIDGITYTESNNTATYKLTNALGCDSIVNLDLTILNSSYYTDMQTACESFTWIDGITYTESNNTATYTLTNIHGCDSIVTLDLTILNSSYGRDMQTACESFTWIDGITYTESNNTATYTLANSLGCDSIVTLDLTILNSSYSTDIQTACESFTWIDGITYTESNNTATYTLNNSPECDSIVTLDLTILKNTSSNIQETACKSYTSPSGHVYDESGIYEDIIPNQSGCDSIITIDLTVIKVNTEVIIEGNNLKSVANNADYIWIDCETMIPIENGINPNYTAPKNGTFAVIVSENGCTDTSACINITTVGIDEDRINENIRIFPNPTTGGVNVSFGSLNRPTIKIFTMDGRLVYEKDEITTENLHLDLNMKSGIYFIEVYSQNDKSIFKLIKK